MRGLLVLSCALAVTGCVGTGAADRLDPVNQGLSAPDGTVVLSDEVDGILVGDRLMAAGEHELALRAYYRAGAANGLSPELMTAIGLANLHLGRLGQAEDQFRRAVDADPGYVPALNNLGVVLMERGAYGEARRIFEQAFALDSGHSDAVRDNLRLAIAQMENSVYGIGHNENGPTLIRRGGGVYSLEAAL